MTTPSWRVRSRVPRTFGACALGLVLSLSGLTHPAAAATGPGVTDPGATGPGAAAGPGAAETGDLPVIVLARPGQESAARAQVAAAGGTLTRDLPLVHGFAAVVGARAVPVLRLGPAIRSITPDTPVRVAADRSSLRVAAGASEPTSVYPQAVGADQVWRAGDKGQGVTVAMIDTGVAASPDLAGRMVTVSDGLLSPSQPCKNLSGEPSCQDNYGHGTFVGGVIAGDGSSSGGTYSGVAPRAKLLSIKVAGADGSTDVSNVLAAIQWVVSYRSMYSIRVLNLSLSTDSAQTYRTDPFNYAVERAWDAGIVVVVSASNRGPSAATISKPADDPLVITVGASDDRGTPGIGDDELPDFSSRGPTVPDGLAKPDLVAPGCHLMSLRAVGSTLDRQFPSSDGAYHRGSGTSFSAAVTSGTVALMLARHPELEPNQVKYALTHSSRELPAGSDPAVVGAGTLDAARAALNPPAGAANAGVVRSNGTGLLQLSRGHVGVQTIAVPSTVVNGLLTTQLLLWDPTGYLLGWSPVTWVVSPWALTPIQPVRWSDDDWSGRNWGGRNWGGGNWQGSTWDGAAIARDYGSPPDGALWFGAWG
jgi:serine protease AprX